MARGPVSTRDLAGLEAGNCKMGQSGRRNCCPCVRPGQGELRLTSSGQWNHRVPSLINPDKW